jgi:gliding motility-associated-like protein
LSAGTLCEGDSTKLIATGGEKYQWLYNDTLISNATNDNFYAKKDGVYKAFVYNSAGCKNMAIDSALVNSYKKPYINFSAANACINSMINFKNISNTSLSGAVTWVWYFSNGNQSNAINASQVFSKAGTYQITLKAIPQSCPALATSVSIPIQISSPEPGIIYPSTKYKWLPPFYLDNINSPNPTYTGNKPMVYVVKIQNIEGCVTVDTVAVNVFQNIDILVPKAFSPNADGHNDLLDVFTIGIKDFKFFRVFNRWGQLLYETRNADQKWDGTYHGVKQPSETYVWIAEGIGIDDKIVQKRGQTILLR